VLRSAEHQSGTAPYQASRRIGDEFQTISVAMREYFSGPYYVQHLHGRHGNKYDSAHYDYSYHMEYGRNRPVNVIAVIATPASNWPYD
jgi:hypothetical protein